MKKVDLTARKHMMTEEIKQLTKFVNDDYIQDLIEGWRKDAIFEVLMTGLSKFVTIHSDAVVHATSTYSPLLNIYIDITFVGEYAKVIDVLTADVIHGGRTSINVASKILNAELIGTRIFEHKGYRIVITNKAEFKLSDEDMTILRAIGKIETITETTTEEVSFC